MKCIRYIVGVFRRLRPSRLREYVELGQEEAGEAFYEHLVDCAPEGPMEEAEREFDWWWASTHRRRDRVVGFLHYLFQIRPRDLRRLEAGL